jgi:hypothetical protein
LCTGSACLRGVRGDVHLVTFVREDFFQKSADLAFVIDD